MRSFCVLAATVLGALALAGCGSSDSDDVRAPVVAFLADLEAERYEQACARLTDDGVAQMREDALRGYVPGRRAGAARSREVRELYRRVRSCPGALAVRREQVRDGLSAERADVRGAPMLVDRSLSTVGVDGQEWFLEAQDGTWRIDATNATFGDPASG